MTDVRLGRLGGLALLVPALLAGCAHYKARPIDPGASAAALSARRLNDPNLLRFLAVMGRGSKPKWTLDTLTLVAVYERPEIQIADAGYAIAKGGVTTAAAIPNPTLGISPTYNTTTGYPSPLKIGPVVSFLVTSFGARPAAIAAARAETTAARELVGSAAWRERKQVRDALLALWHAQRQAALARRSAGYAEAALGVLSERFKVGAVSINALTVQRLSAEQARFVAVEANRQERLARAGLATALGLPDVALKGVRLDLSAFNRIEARRDLGALARRALIARPSIQAALARYEAAQDRLKVAIDEQYPGFRIGPGYHYDQGDNKFILALSVPLPVFNQNQGPIAVARAQRQLAAAQFDSAQQRVLAEIETAQTDWRASRDARLAAERAAASAGRGEAAARRDFRAGATGRLQLLSAQQAASLAQQNALTAEMQARTALGHLEDALHHRFFRSRA